MREVAAPPVPGLDVHAEFAHLAGAVAALRAQAEGVAQRFRGRTLWMVNSTAHGGGVSEMLPGMIGHLNELGIATRWLVIEADDDRFFQLTKRLHNMIHGAPGDPPGEQERDVYEATNRRNAEAALRHVAPGDVLAVHDPQPMALAGYVREHIDLRTVWRSHIGLDEVTPPATAAWRFLEPYAAAYDHAIFSAPEYVVPFFRNRATVIYPSLDPLAEKNRPLHVQQVVAMLERTGLLGEPLPRAGPALPFHAQRLQADGSFGPATQPDDLGLLTRPVVMQVSRWDRLKGFLPLMHGFASMKRQTGGGDGGGEERARLGLARLVLAGPDPRSVADDPEGGAVLDELRAAYMDLDPAVRADVAVLALPMEDPALNALVVNALQRVSTVVVQNSLREGFGLTITEALWKGVPVLSNSRACGPRQQITDDVEGRLIPDPADAEMIGRTLADMLADADRLERWGRSAQRRVHEQFLVYEQLSRWLDLLDTLCAPGPDAA